MYSSDPMVRLLSGLALATFAYNNISEQKEIADQGGVRFNCFVPFLQSNDEMYRCLAAFQVYVLCVIIYEANLLFFIFFINFMVYSVLEFQTKTICIFLL
jgi:hypothetical protein